MAVILCPLIRQVWLRGSAIRLATSWLLGERSEPFLAAKRHISMWSGRPQATKLREVELSRLQGFHLHFVPKMGSGVTRIWGFRFHLRVLDFNGGMSWFHSDQIYRACMCISIIEGANLFTVCESWRPQAARKQRKLVSPLSQHWERRSPVTVF